jgi:hypothetical protein
MWPRSPDTYRRSSAIDSFSPIAVAERSGARTIFARSNTESLGSNPTRGIHVCVCLFCAVLCVRKGNESSWSLVQGVLQCIGERNWKKKAVIAQQWTAEQIMMMIIINNSPLLLMLTRSESVNKTRFDFPRSSFNILKSLLFTPIVVWKQHRCLNSEKLWITATGNIITVMKVLKLQVNYEKIQNTEDQITKEVMCYTRF